MAYITPSDFYADRYFFYTERLLDVQFGDQNVHAFILDQCAYYYSKWCDAYPFDQLLKDWNIDSLIHQIQTIK